MQLPCSPGLKEDEERNQSPPLQEGKASTKPHIKARSPPGLEEPPPSAWGHAILLYGSVSLAETVIQNNTVSWSKEGCGVCKTSEIFQKDEKRVGRDPAHGGHQYGSISLLAMKMPKNTVVYALEEVKDQVPQWKENAKQKELLMQAVQSS